MYIVEKPGRIAIAGMDGQVIATPFLDITDRVNDNGGERGLLGLAFSPNYADDGYFFVNYTGSGGSTVVSRFTRSNADPNQADPDSEVELLNFSQPFSNHNGGDLAFGPDGFLYISSGDGGSGGDPQNNSQTRTNLLGKILRIDVLSQPGTYVIPADNPFANDDQTLDEIWALGLRNPWRMSFDRETGDLWIGDVGQNSKEEVDFQPASSTGGENYGWRCYEGNEPFMNTASCPDASELTFPVHTYNTSGTNPGCSVTGGYVYRGCDYPEMIGRYIYADYCSGRIWSLTPNGSGGFTNVELLNGANFEFSSFGEFQGELYLTAFDEGRVYKVTDANAQPLTVNGVVTDESCADQTDGVISLSFENGDPQSIQWSNGATTNEISGLNGGTYSVTISINDDCQIVRNFVVETGLPDAPDVLLDINTNELSIVDLFVSYQWLFNGEVIDGATEPTYQPTESGDYTVIVVNDQGCELTANGVDVVISGTNDFAGLRALRITPNPFTDFVLVDFTLDEPTAPRLELFNVRGQLVRQHQFDAATRQQHRLATNDLAPGVYLLRIVGTNGSRTVRIVK